MYGPEDLVLGKTFAQDMLEAGADPYVLLLLMVLFAIMVITIKEK